MQNDMFYYEEMGRISILSGTLIHKCLLYKGKAKHVPSVRMVTNKTESRCIGHLNGVEIGIWKFLIMIY